MADEQLVKLLIAAASADQAAEKAIRDAEEQNFTHYLQSLGGILATEGVQPQARQLAGLLIKNSLAARDDATVGFKQERWKTLDATVRDSVKAPLLIAMRCPERFVNHTAAQAAAEVAAVELPYGEWKEFLPAMLENVREATYSDNVKIASLECLGYCCERINMLGGVVNEESTDAMLNTIVDGINPTRPDTVRFAAAGALRNSLGFASKNMDKPEECTAIMNTLMEATRAKTAAVRAMAYDGIVQVAIMYYSKLSEFMTTIYQLTTHTIQKDEEDVAKAAIEFWTSLCEVEQDLIDEAAELEAQNLPPKTPCNRYVAAAVSHLVPILEETLTKQEEDVDEDAFTLQMAGQLCLTNVSQTVEDAVVPVIAPFVSQHIQNEDWHYRDAAILAFISMLEGPSQEVIGPYVSQSVPVLMNLLNDSHIVVRDSAAHCISRICLLHIQFIPPDHFPSLLGALNEKCKDGNPKVASQAASAIFNLAQAFRDQNEQESNLLSPYMQNLLETLLASADRRDAEEANLRVACMEAISELISVAAKDCRPMLGQSLPEFIRRFEQTFSMSDLNESDKFRREQIQGLLCAVIQSLYRQLDKATLLPASDTVMRLLLQVLNIRNASCHEECFSALSAIADALEVDFTKYMEALATFLIAALRNFEAYQVCIVAVGLVGDICRNIEGQIQPYCDNIMNALVEDLKDSKIHRSVKPPVLSCFGDIAMAIGAGFQPYLDFSMMMLMQAANTTVPPDDDDLVEFLNLLRESILEAFVGIIQGLRDGNLLPTLAKYVGPMMQFLAAIANDPNRDDYVLNKAVGLLGDIAQNSQELSIPAHVFQDEFVMRLITEASQCGDQGTLETAQWAGGVIQQVMQAQGAATGPP